MVNETILAVITAFIISAVMCPIVIPFLHKLKFGQQVREDGPQAHLKKQGTPTMGGVVILGAIVITSLLYIRDYPKIIPILFVTVGFGIIGFLDDYIKIVMKRSEGLNPKQKLLGQFVITGIFAYYLISSREVGTSMLIPFTGGFDGGFFLELPPVLFVPALFFIVLGTDNGVNFTDGLDGLCTSVTILVATFFTIVAIGENTGISPITGAVVGSLLGFLLFNVYPAKVFMGDTGSLALGGFVASSAFMMQMPIFIAAGGADLSGGGAVGDYSGNLLQEHRRKADFQDGADPSPLRAVRVVGDKSSGSIFNYNGNPLPGCVLRIIGGNRQ